MRKQIADLIAGFKYYYQVGKLQQRLIDMNYTELGIGSARVVYRISPTRVMKIALNTAGKYQNMQEYVMSNSYKKYFLTKTYSEYNDYKVIVSEYVDQLTNAKFNAIYGTGFSRFSRIILWDKPTNVKRDSEVFIRLVDDVRKFCKDTGTPLDEFSDIWQWGFDGKKAKILDYGLTDKIFRRWYRK